ncbi:response regulator [Candidatus Magnetominusculus xianensis]|uniref:histidine kinase n=1 Tax=Candidatus Magnetominusculus xianensis TaxID=1748249 RepID=A0ABR5SJ45_9BACT|nr:response regulator [Candidatus Magnetominusculus xianensis]KWT91955.1 histidine kinase [Candidatus Magnetominusculus xianensis]MBF0403228.1 response regulator [Nitrospirota bacterium]
MIKNLKIGTRITIGYLLILLVFLLLSLYSISRLNYSAAQTKQLYEHPFMVKSKLLSTEANTYRIRFLLRKASMLTNNDDIVDIKAMVASLEHEVINDLTAVENLFLGDKKLIKQIHSNYEKDIALHHDYFYLLFQGKKTDALSLLDSKLYANATETEKMLDEAIEFASNKAASFYENTKKTYDESEKVLYYVLCVSIVMSGVLSFVVTRIITVPIAKLLGATKEIASGNLNVMIDVSAKDEIGRLSKSFQHMVDTLRNNVSMSEIENWKKNGYAQINAVMRGEQDVITLSQNLITYTSEYIGANIGAIYLVQESNNTLRLTGTYAYNKRKNLSNEFSFGDGVVGQAALEKQTILLTEVPADYIKITSGLGERVPSNILVTPLIYNNKVKGVIEIGAFAAFTDHQIEFMKAVSEGIAIAISVAQSRETMRELLEETQSQAEELQVQQEELRTNNEQLASQARILKESEVKLQEQQEELRQANEELEEHAKLMEKQRDEIKKKNIELEKNQELNLQKAKELAITSKYKSEFLANMSHELRTPLNSILLLSKFLSENKDSNLTPKQIECASTVYSSGRDLLSLINDILDLSKVEAGKLELHIEAMETTRIKTFIESNFLPLTEEKNIALQVTISEGAPKQIHTDTQKIDQIIRNLLSNAIKFTEKGAITVTIDKPVKPHPDGLLSISISDTGIGIPQDKLGIIFEAFKQADGTTSRKYGGTGLGLTISKELIKLLQGEIVVNSDYGAGSTFTMFIPDLKDASISQDIHQLSQRPDDLASPAKPEVPEIKVRYIEDDRENLTAGEKSILIIEDDTAFAKILLDISRERGYKSIAVQNGTDGLEAAHIYKPDAIILDMGLPDMDGWTVIERLKESSETRSIPVQIISASEKNIDVLKSGSIGYLTKPVNMEKIEEAFLKIETIFTGKNKQIMAVNLDTRQEATLRELLKNTSVGVDYVPAKKAQTDIELNRCDCIVMNISGSEQVSFSFLDKIKNTEPLNNIPVIIYNSTRLNAVDEMKLSLYAQRIVIKAVKSPDRLLEEIVLFLHLPEAELPKEKQTTLMRLRDKEHIFRGKNILITDDDSRNVFALTSILEERGINILVAGTGVECIDTLKGNDTIDLVLMDIMMPEMDGYEAIKEARKMRRYRDVPIIALTAKAMKEDRIRCIEAGANDYLAKPIDKDRLLSLLRIWLYQ